MQRTLVGTAVVAATGVAALAVLPLFIDGESFRKPLQQVLTRSTGREVLLGRLELSTFGAIGLRTDELRLGTSDGPADLEARGAFVELALWPLLTRRLQVQAIELEGAELSLKRYRDGRWNFSDFALRPVAGEQPLDLAQVGLRLLDSTVSIDDEAVQPPQRFAVTGLSLNIKKLDRRDLPINLQAKVTNSLRDKPVTAALTLDGNLVLPEDGDWQKLSGKLRILAAKFRPRYLSAYTQQIPSLAGLTGVFDLNFDWQGQLGGQSRLAGTVGTRLLHWDWPAVFATTPWVVRRVNVQTALTIDGDSVRADQLHLTGENLDANLSGNIVRPAGPDPKPQLDVAVRSGFIDPYALRANLPLGLFSADLRNWLVQSKGAGRLRFADLRLRGAIDKLSTEGSLEFQNLKLINPRLRSPIDVLGGKVDFTESALQLVALRVGPAGAETTLNGTVNRTTDGLLSLKATGANADLSAFSNLASGRLGTLGGRANLDLTIDGTLDAPKLQGRAELLGASLQRDGWAQPLKNARGSLVFEPDKLTITGLQADLGDSSLNVEGVLNRYGTDSADPQIAITSDGLALKAAYSLLASDLFEGDFRRAFRSTFSSLAGTAAVDLKLAGSTTTGKLDLRGATIGLADLRTPLENAVGSVVLSERGTTIPQLRVSAAGSPLNLKGFVSRYGDMQLTGDGTLNFPAAVALLTPKGQGNIRASGSAPVSFSLGGSEARSLSATVDLSGLSDFVVGGTLALAPARRLTLSGTLSPSALALDSNSRLELEDIALAISGTIANVGRASQRYNLRLRSDSAVELTTLSRYVTPLGNLGIASGTPSPLEAQLVGSAPEVESTLQLSNVNLPGLLGGIADLSGPVSLSGNRVSTTGLTFRLGESNGRVSGSLSNPQDPALNFDLRLDRLNIDNLLTSALAGENNLKNLHGQGSLRIDAGVLSRLNFTDLSAQARLDRGIWNLSGLTVSLAEGRMSGSLGTNVRNAVPLFNGDIALRGTDVNQLATVFLGFGNQIAGSADLSINFQSQGSTPEAFVEGLSGSGSLLIQNGRLSTADLLGPLFGSTGNLAGSVRGFNTGRFDRFEGAFRIERGTATGDNFSYLTPNVQLRLGGNLQLTGDRSAALKGTGEFVRASAALLGQIRKASGGPEFFSFEVNGPIAQAASLRELRWVEATPATPSLPTGSTSTP